MTRSGWTGRRRRRWRLRRAGCWPRRWRWCSAHGSRARRSGGLPQLPVGGLREGDARELLSSVIGGPLDERVRDRIIAETRGNPLALLELPRGVPGVPGLAELAGVAEWAGLRGGIGESFGRRVEVLPASTQRLMLVAAAEPAGEPALVWRAAERLGVGTGDRAPAAGPRGRC